MRLSLRGLWNNKIKLNGFNRNRLSDVKLTDYMKLVAEQSVNNKVRKSTIHAVVCIHRMEYC